MNEYVVLAHTKGTDTDATEWTIFDGRMAEEAAHAYAARLRDRGYRAVFIRQCGPIIARLITTP